MINPVTSATSVGVAIRYAATIAATVVTILGILNWLSPQQVAELSRQVPELFGAIAALITALIPLYAMITKSHSDKAAAVAKAVDAAIPAAQAVIIPTPDGIADIIVQPGKGR